MPNEKRSARTTKKQGSDRLTVREKNENQSRLSVILGVSQSEKTVRKLLKQVEKLCPKEIIVVVNGSRDESIDIVLSYTTYTLKVYVYPFALGEDVWRSIGAREASGDVLLFLDADTVIHAEELQPFAIACYKGVDIALQRAKPSSIPGVLDRSTVMLARTYLNNLLEHNELGTSSMCDVPFAITRTAASRIGIQHLLIPPLAHAMAIDIGLRIERSHCIKEALQAHRGRLFKGKKAWRDLTSLGDHIEAIQYVAKRCVSEIP
ncbi:glycosyltransferase family 2 protein [Brevibacillus sp. NRS-1366]|uniref:glycosyltransferase family 2 protein n=1 Tax=Brevibacillus sp. NRS-1366 TaxID=3233899 RepID=UPI003D260EA7